MKHKIFALGVTLICMLGLTACGSSIQKNTVAGSRYDEAVFTKDYLLSVAQTLEDDYFENMYLQGITPDNFKEKLEDSFDESMLDVFAAGYRNWYDAIDELGYSSPDTLSEDISVTHIDEFSYYVNKDGELMVDATIEGKGNNSHTAVLEYSLDRKGMPTLISVNVNHSLPEKLKSAGLNTLLGMGMAFTVLIIIALVISLFPLINKMTEKKPETSKEITQKSMETVTSQIAEKEELSDDDELVAVIAAAIAAYQGSATAGGDGFVVRSVRKVGKASNWKRA
ncbi:OadG family protein [Butyrivibrio sp. AC2005]|uniref:OadG family protein n=1 Tax=Butyrivibrio sp. AC2005 TaxID=1280672 RepID=UPI00040B8D17|nr:OadG family protein [Butyrivibrio sp. AC2005]